jgi:CRISPR-associated protein Csb1
MNATTKPWKYEDQLGAVAGPVAALRLGVRLQPAGGAGDKVFPSTTAGGMYAREERRLGGRVVATVLLDSVQSQANRLEQALLRAHDEGRVGFPLLAVDFSSIPEVGRITSLDAPHRIADAVFRDSLLDDVPFRSSELGLAYEAATINNATSLYRACPTALIFGTWDSAGPRGGGGHKFARALVSEIVGVDVVEGVRTSSRIDPSGITNLPLYQDKDMDGQYTVDEAQAARDEKGKPRRYEVKGKPRKTSEINLGNVTPDLVRASKDAKVPRSNVTIVRAGAVLPGGVTMDHAIQTTTLSLPGLRRLRFPDAGGRSTPARDRAGHVVLAALALVAITLRREQGYDLRSRCLLVPEGEAPFEAVTGAGAGQTTRFTLDAAGAIALLSRAVEVAEEAKLSWTSTTQVLQPSPGLVGLIKKSREILAAGAGDDEDVTGEAP